MLRVTIWTAAFTLVAGGALAAPSLELSGRTPQSEQQAPSVGDDTAGGIELVRGGRGGGGRGGGGRGGFKRGNRAHAQRHIGEPGRPGRIGDPGGIRGGGIHHVRHGEINNVNIDRNVRVGGGGYYGDYDDDDDLGEAIVGGIVGGAIGNLLTGGANQ